MPRDLGLGGMPALVTESPEGPDYNEALSPASERRFIMQINTQPVRAKAEPFHSLHPYTSPLTISDVESCVALENAAFPENERCSREKFTYRLTKCGELCLGLFSTEEPNSEDPAETLKTGHLVETGRENGAIGVLIAHIVATRSISEVVTDEAMDYPKDWDSVNPKPSHTGHQEEGRTICIHSLGVLPKYQNRGLGRILMTAYIQQMNGAGIADRLAIIAHDHLVGYYEKLGFTSKGPSKAQFGGGGWTDMVIELKPVEAHAMYG